MHIYNYSFLISVVSFHACNRSLISLEAFVCKITLIGLMLTKYQIKRRARFQLIIKDVKQQWNLE